MIETILILLLCFVVAYGLIALFFYIFQETLLFQAKPMAADADYAFDFPFEERNYEMADGAKLNALFIPSAQSRGVILYFHGNAGNLERWGEIVAPFRKTGHDVLIFDYRGYGKSKGRRSMQRLFSDAKAMYEVLLEHYAPEEIILYGRSIGSSMATWLAARARAQRLILETPFYRINDILAFRFLMLPAELLLRYPFRNDREMEKVSMPVHIIHGTLDGVVPYFSGKKLYDGFQSSTPMELITIAGGRHNNLVDYPKFHREIERILSLDKLS